MTVFFGSSDSTLYAVSASSGVRVWEYATGGAIVSSPVLDSAGRVYFGSWDNSTYAVNASEGYLLWSSAVGSPISSSPSLDPTELMLFIGTDSSLYALDVSSGSEVWSTTIGGAITSSIAVDASGGLYVGNSKGFFFSFNVTTGSLNWCYATMQAVAFQASPAVDSAGRVFISSSGAKLYAFSANDGTLLWNATAGAGGASSPAIDVSGRVFVGGSDSKIHAFNAGTGGLLFNFTTSGPIIASPAIDSIGQVYVGSGDGYLYAFNSHFCARPGTEWRMGQSGTYCAPCSPGTFNPNSTTGGVCLPCSTGFYTFSRGAVACSACPPGFTSPPQASVCSPIVLRGNMTIKNIAIVSDGGVLPPSGAYITYASVAPSFSVSNGSTSVSSNSTLTVLEGGNVPSSTIFLSARVMSVRSLLDNTPISPPPSISSAGQASGSWLAQIFAGSSVGAVCGCAFSPCRFIFSATPLWMPLASTADVAVFSLSVGAAWSTNGSAASLADDIIEVNNLFCSLILPSLAFGDLRAFTVSSDGIVSLVAPPPVPVPAVVNAVDDAPVTLWRSYLPMYSTSRAQYLLGSLNASTFQQYTAATAWRDVALLGEDDYTAQARILGNSDAFLFSNGALALSEGSIVSLFANGSSFSRFASSSSQLEVKLAGLTLPHVTSADGSILSFVTPSYDLVCNTSLSKLQSLSAGSSSGSRGVLVRTTSICLEPILLLRSVLSNSMSAEGEAFSLLTSGAGLPGERLSGGISCPPACGEGYLPSQSISSDALGGSSSSLYSSAAAFSGSGSSGLFYSFSSPLAASVRLTQESVNMGIIYIRPCPSSPPPIPSICGNISNPVSKTCKWGEPPDCSPCPPGGLCPGGYRLWSRPGYFVSTEASLNFPYYCAYPSAERCHAWDPQRGEMMCGVGYKQGSPLCSACATGFYYDLGTGGSCLACPITLSAAAYLGSAVFTVLGVLLVIAAVVFTLVWAISVRSGHATIKAAAMRTMLFIFASYTSLQTIVQVAKSISPSSTLPAARPILAALLTLQFQGVGPVSPSCSSLPPLSSQTTILALSLAAFALWCLAISLVYFDTYAHFFRACSCSGLKSPFTATRTAAIRSSFHAQSSGPLDSKAGGGSGDRRCRIPPSLLPYAAKVANLCGTCLTIFFAIIVNASLDMLSCADSEVTLQQYSQLDGDGTMAEKLLGLDPAAYLAALQDDALSHTLFTVPFLKSNPTIICYEGTHAIAFKLAVAVLVLCMFIFPAVSLLVLKYLAIPTLLAETRVPQYLADKEGIADKKRPFPHVSFGGIFLDSELVRANTQAAEPTPAALKTEQITVDAHFLAAAGLSNKVAKASPAMAFEPVGVDKAGSPPAGKKKGNIPFSPAPPASSSARRSDTPEGISGGELINPMARGGSPQTLTWNGMLLSAMTDADVLSEMSRRARPGEGKGGRRNAFCQLLLRIAAFFCKRIPSLGTKKPLTDTTAAVKPKKERRFIYLSDGTAIQVRLMRRRAAEDDPTSLHSPSATSPPAGKMESEDIEIAVCGCRSCCTRRFPSTDVDAADMVDSSIALNMRRILAVAPKGTLPPPRYPAHLFESMTPFLASNFRPSQYAFIYFDFAIMMLTGAVTVLQTAVAPEAAAAVDGSIDTGSDNSSSSSNSSAPQSSAYYAVTIIAILTLLASSVATMTVLPFHSSKLWLQPVNAYIQAISALALINALAGATANSPSKLAAAQAFSVVTGVACIILFPLILISFLISLIGGIDFHYSEESSKKVWHKSSLFSAKQKRNSWGVSMHTTGPVARRPSLRPPNGPPSTPTLSNGQANPLYPPPAILPTPSALLPADPPSLPPAAVRAYSDDEIFAAGWERTSGGALFFNKELGRTLISDDKLPRGWAYSKTSIAQGNKKRYENLVTGECRDDFPTLDLAVAAGNSRRYRSAVISTGKKHVSMTMEGEMSGEATITNPLNLNRESSNV